MRTRLAVVGCGMAVVLGLSGCALVGVSPDTDVPSLPGASTPTPTAWPDGRPIVAPELQEQADAIQRGYRTGVEDIPAGSFPLPPGRSFPRYAEIPVFRGAAPHELDDIGEGDAVDYWQCAWTDRYLTLVDKGDAAGANAALDALAKWPTLAYVQAHFVSSAMTQWSDEYITPARAGDDSALKADQSGCTFFYDSIAKKH